MSRTAAAFLREYEQCTNTHRFEKIAPLIAENAVYWFNDGSFYGKQAIQEAIELTWRTIENEHYAIENVQWLINDEHMAVCLYVFRWQGNIAGQPAQGEGRGTSVLICRAGRWQVLHEHLSALPQK